MKTIILVLACFVTFNSAFAKTTLAPSATDVIKKEPILDTGSVDPDDLDGEPSEK